VSTVSNPREQGHPPLEPFSDSEIASAVGGPPGDPEVEETEPADIDERAGDQEAPFEKLVQRSARLTPEKVKRVLQSLLLVADKPASIDALYQSTGIAKKSLQEALERMALELRETESGIALEEVSGGWQFRTDVESAEYVRRFLQVKPQRLTRAAVETLAIIAYRQPVTRPEIEEIRSVDSAAVLKALLDRRLVKILGKKEEVGRPILYGTTKEFLEFFALKDLASLPTLREFQELTKEHQEIVEKETAPAAKVEGTLAALADPHFRERLDETTEDAERALQELEGAIAGADERSKAASQLLNPPPPSEPGPKPD
jgi:segregation and condensation protein B